MNKLAEVFASLLVAVSWLAGIVLAHGFWSTTAAVCLPPYAWYLLVERIMVLVVLV